MKRRGRKVNICVLLLVLENEIPSPLYVMISITLSSSKFPIKILWYLSFSLAAPAMMRTLLLATILSAAKQVTSSVTVANSATFKRWCPCYHIIIIFINRVLNRVFVARETWNPGLREVPAKEVPQKKCPQLKYSRQPSVAALALVLATSATLSTSSRCPRCAS